MNRKGYSSKSMLCKISLRQIYEKISKFCVKIDRGRSWTKRISFFISLWPHNVVKIKNKVEIRNERVRKPLENIFHQNRSERNFYHFVKPTQKNFLTFFWLFLTIEKLSKNDAPIWAVQHRVALFLIIDTDMVGLAWKFWTNSEGVWTF